MSVAETEMSVILLATLGLLGKEIVLQMTNVVDVTATGCTSAVTLYVNGFPSTSAQPTAEERVTFPAVRLRRGVTDVRGEAGAESDRLSWRLGETERGCPGENPK